MRSVLGAIVCAVALLGARVDHADAAAANGQIAAIARATCTGCPAAGRLVTLNADGSGLRTLWSAPGQADGLNGPAWSPDGNRIAFSYADADHGTRIMVYDIASGQVHAVTDHAATVDIGGTAVAIRDVDPGWSPDGTHILFRRTPYVTALGDVLQIAASVPVDGGTPDRLPVTLDPAVTRSSFSPDGASLGYVLPPALHVVRASGDRVLVPDGARGAPSWSPDGTLLAFTNNAAPDAVNLRTVAVATGAQPADLTAPASGSTDSGPEFSPDGTQVLYAHVDAGAAPELRVVSRDGGTPRTVFRSSSQVTVLSDPDWQPCVADVTASCTSYSPPQCPAASAAVTAAGQPLDLPPVPCTDPAGRSLTVTVVKAPDHGTLTGWRYTPAAGFSGQDTIVYKVSNGIADSDVTRLSITVVAAPPPPATQELPAVTPTPPAPRPPYLNARRSPALDRHGRAVLRASCDSTCALTLRLSVRVRGHGTVTSAQLTKKAAAGGALILRFKLRHSVAHEKLSSGWITGTVHGAGGTRSIKVPVSLPR